MKFLILVILWMVYNTLRSNFLMKKCKNLNEERIKQGYDSQYFLDYFSGKKIDKTLCLVVYDYFQKEMAFIGDDFRVMPTDGILEVYGKARLDFVMAVSEIVEFYFQKYMIDTEAEEKAQDVIQIILDEDLEKIKTISDVVVFLATRSHELYGNGYI